MGETATGGRRGAALGLVLGLWACVPADPPEGPRRARAGPSPPSTASVARASRASDRPEAGPAEFAVERDPLLERAFSDDFERSSLGSEYSATSAVWRLEEGRLCARAARNRPVWLRRRLPRNVRVEFDAESASLDGDIKVELFGDGRSRARSNSYIDATSYLAIFGGWKNGFHVLARLDEHSSGRLELGVDPSSPEPRAQPVVPNRRYRFRLERLDGATLRWFVDGVALFGFADPEPLHGEGHEYFAFNDWETPVCFDNLRIEPLGG
jgi:hypothetical protein